MKKTEKTFTLNLYHVISGIVIIIAAAIGLWCFDIVSGGALISAGVTILLIVAIMATQVKDVEVLKNKEGNNETTR